MKFIPCFAAVLAAALPLAAGETRNWTQGGFTDFEKGVIRKLSLSSDGVLTLAPLSEEVLDTSSSYLWALARDSKGNLYTGGGAGAKLHMRSPDGKSRVLAELEGLEIHAIAVDKQDRVYAATAPDGKVYRVSAAGKAEVFFDPKAKYIWAMAFDPAGDLLVATGGAGEIFRVSPDGKGKVCYQTDETHVRSMAVLADGTIVAGTEPSGLVIRVSPKGEGFVLYQASKKEVTALAAAADGTIWAAAVGTKQARPATEGSTSPTPPPQIAITTQSAAPGAAGARASTLPPPPTMAPSPQAVTGGSEVWRIEPNGNPRRVWNHASDIVYAIALDAQGRALLGTGNKGHVYRIESPSRYTSLIDLTSTQVTAFLSAPDGRLYAATGNVGKVYRIGPEIEREGTIESDVFDAGAFSAWGRLIFEAKLNGGTVAVSTRTGNHDQPRKHWSAWSESIASTKGARVSSPPARFAQWRATLKGGASGTPELEMVDLAYLPKNLEPRLEQIEIVTANYKFPAPSAPSTAPATLNLPTLGRRASTSSLSLDTGGTSTPTLTFAKGSMSTRWLAADPNGDAMTYTVEIRAEGETTWKPLKKQVREKYCSWDGSAFPDGEYRIRVTASDAPSNPPNEALTAELVSDPFYIDNTPPRISNLTASRNGSKLEARWNAADALNNIRKAEYSLDGGEWTVVSPEGRISDSMELDYRLAIENAAPGEHSLAVRVEDEYDNVTTEKVVVK